MILGKTYQFPDLDMAMEELMWTEAKVGIYKQKNPNVALEHSTQILVGEHGKLFMEFILMTEDDARRYNETDS